MSLKTYNNQTIYVFPNTEPVNDDDAVNRGNSLRLLYKNTNIVQQEDCRNICLNNKDCELYKFDSVNNICKLYRTEPYKIIKDLSLDDCTLFCSKDDDCDYLSHDINNTCKLRTREQIDNAKTCIDDMWFDYSIYGLNRDKGEVIEDFYKGLKKDKQFVYYGNDKYFIPKTFYKPVSGSTTIYFNKNPIENNKIMDLLVGLKSKHRDYIDTIKNIILLTFFAIITIIIYKAINK